MATVLIVEDEAVVLVLSESVIQHAGYETISAATLAEALVLIDTDGQIDLVVTDICLGPETEGGFEVGRSVQSKRPGTPVLYTTARAMTDGMKALAVEPNGYLGKPYTDQQLVQAVASLLRPPEQLRR
jgi:two-component system cell cycle sensor histidine kinase/response regulator CckA